jgi:hypothetical protein
MGSIKQLGNEHRVARQAVSRDQHSDDGGERVSRGHPEQRGKCRLLDNTAQQFAGRVGCNAGDGCDPDHTPNIRGRNKASEGDDTSKTGQILPDRGLGLGLRTANGYANGKPIPGREAIVINTHQIVSGGGAARGRSIELGRPSWVY